MAEPGGDLVQHPVEARPLKRPSFASRDELATRLRDFIAYFNRLLAKPFRWTYKGRPLTA